MKLDTEGMTFITGAREKAKEQRRMYSKKEDELLLKMLGEGKISAEIGKALGRTSNSVLSRIAKLRAMEEEAAKPPFELCPFRHKLPPPTSIDLGYMR